MGGVFGVCTKHECVMDLFFGTDYHSHLATQRGGMAVFDGEHFNRVIHNIENSPFRAKFEPDISELVGCVGVGCISDSGPQPIIVHSRIGVFAIATVGRINNKAALAERLISDDNTFFSDLNGGHINDTELVASIICRRDNIVDGIVYAQSVIEGSMTMLVCAGDCIYAARDKLGRTPLSVGRSGEGGESGSGDSGGVGDGGNYGGGGYDKGGRNRNGGGDDTAGSGGINGNGSSDSGFCVSMESFAYLTLGYKFYYELGPGEVVSITADKVTKLVPPGDAMRICSFLWTYYGFPTSSYEGVTVEEMRYKCGKSLAVQDKAAGVYTDIYYVAGLPDSGTAYAIGYANESDAPFARPLIKYTPTWPRSFMPREQNIREMIARMKLVPIHSLIKNKKLLFIEDSIVRGTQMRGTTDFVHAYGVKELHVGLACPPILFNCKYLNFSRSTSEDELITRNVIHDLEGADGDKHIAEYADNSTRRYRQMVDTVRKNLNLTSLEYHTLDGLLDSIGIGKCKLCTYCWNGCE